MQLPHISNWLRRETSRLYSESIISRMFGWVRLGDTQPFDDRVASLINSPLGMFFYNQRAIFLGAGFCFLITVSAVGAVFHPATDIWPTVALLFAVWLAGVILTLILHHSFRTQLNKWQVQRTINELPPIFDRYFLFDFFLVFVLVFVGKLLKMNLEGFVFLLLANLVVWSAYIGGGRRSKRVVMGVFLLVFIVAVFWFSSIPSTDTPRNWFSLTLYWGPLFGMSGLTVFCVLMVARLRAIEHQVTQGHLELLGKYEDRLSVPASRSVEASQKPTSEEYSEQQFHRRVSLVLEDLCCLTSPFWYYRACLLFLEEHKDRGTLFIPGPRFRFPEADKYTEGIRPSLMGFINCNDVVVYHPAKASEDERKNILKEFRPLTAPAAFIPLRQEGERIGVLALYGEEGGVHMQRPDEAFLRSLASIISNTKQQWAGRYRTFSQREMNDLFKYQTLEDVFPRAAGILKRYLEAAGCMVVFRRDPNAQEMEIVAKDGFTDAIFANEYVVGRGLTGKCAEDGLSIRRDDVKKHQTEFDPDYLNTLAEAHGAPIVSWMAIPLGPSKKNYGVIKVVNSKFSCNWFSAYDESLGEDLALRLQVIIEKFLEIKERAEASARAKSHAEIAEQSARDALQAQKAAERSARQRQEDLMTITHQLQGPLIPVIGTLSGLVTANLPPPLKGKLEQAQALVEDAFLLSFGTFTTFALEADQKPAFGADQIDAKLELRNLCDRLRRTNSRQDLSFHFEGSKEFPTFTIDRNIFVCVLYSLIHNAMKYADQHSEIVLETGFEYPGEIPVLKVKSYGEPIHPAEREAIFQKFKRGRSATKGRHHTGVGLGLWVARELMRYIGGDLTVELSSNHPKLSIFVLRMPLLHS